MNPKYSVKECLGFFKILNSKKQVNLKQYQFNNYENKF